MNAMIRTLAAASCVIALTLATPSAQAFDGRGPHQGRHAFHGRHAVRSHVFKDSSASVFPPPRDPWRGWGVRSELPQRVGPPRFHHGVHVVTPMPRAVWVPGQWVWDGFTWVWVSGHWVR